MTRPPVGSPVGEPDPAAVVAAAARIAGLVHRTPLQRSRAVDDWVGAPVLLKAEHLQRAGAFKARGATNAVRSLPADVAARGVATHSSGNHGAALAMAAAAAGVACHVVMPANAPAVKRAACEGYGGRVTTCDPDVAAREGALAEVVATTGAHVVHPYDDPSVIAGAGTAALEALAQAAELGRPPAAVVTPVGGGGLLSGTVLAVRGEVGDQVAVHGAEPAGADDTARGLASGVRQPAVHPPATICDGLLTSLSPRTFAILGGRHDPHGTGPVPGVDGVTVVPDEDTVAAMRVLWERAKQVVEPSAAVAVAAARQLVASGRLDPAGPIVVVLSGGNVDLAALPFGGPLDPPG